MKKLLFNKIYFNYITVTYLLAAVILSLNIAFWQFAPLGFLFSGIYIISYILFFLENCFLEKKNLFVKIIFALTILLSQISILGTIFYYILHLLPSSGATILLIITIFNFVVFANKRKAKKHLKFTIPKQKASLVIIALYGLFLGLTLFNLFQNQTLESIRSPWEQVNYPFFLYYFLATSSLMFLLFKNRLKSLTPVFIGIHFTLSCSIALILYRVGYGFDPFIHTATEEFIAENGSITPKNFYYIGQYSIIVILHQLTSLKISILDKLLVPALTFSIPFFYYSALGQFIKKTKFIKSYFPVLFLLLIPYSHLLMTTPYNLSVLFFLLSIAMAWEFSLTGKKKHLFFNLLLAVTSLVAHPIGGIASLLTTFFTLLYKYWKQITNAFPASRYLLIFISTISVLTLPVLFSLNAILQGNIAGILKSSGLENIKNSLLANTPNIQFESNFNLLYDIAYFWGQNIRILYLVLVIFGIILFIKNKFFKVHTAFLITFAVLFLNTIFIEGFIDFQELIEYERRDYALRVLSLSFYLLVPFFMISWYHIIYKAKYNKLFQVFLLICTALLMTNVLYFSYPRHNKYETGRGYSVSKSDLLAVSKVEQLAGNSKYIVLANQNLGAAALKLTGFNRYYLEKNSTAEHYYYSIPTGAPLYQYYLDMVYKQPTRELAKEAANLIDAENVYLIVNDYWTSSEIIYQNAKAQADSVYSINNGSIYIFEFKNL